jgi:hypothetical protein
LSPQAKEQVEYLVRMVQNGPGILRRYDLADAPIKGCKVLLQSSCRLTGLQAIHAWASALNKTLEVIDMHYLFRNDGDEADYCKPQEVFAATSGTGHLLALIDGRQRLGVDLEPSQEMQAFYHELAAFEGTALVLTDRPMSQRFSTRIFHEKRQLVGPDQAVQRAYGQKVLGVDAGSEEAADWRELTAKYQLTLEQIQCIVQRMGLLQAGTGNGYSNRMLLEQAISLEVGVGQGQWLFGDRFE